MGGPLPMQDASIKLVEVARKDLELLGRLAGLGVNMATTVYEPLIEGTLALRNLETFDEAKLQGLVMELALLPLDFLENERKLNRFNQRLAERSGKSSLRLRLMGEIYFLTMSYKRTKVLPVMAYHFHESIQTILMEGK